jgi:tetratricopeptide (TPR) repeat protein
MATSMSRGDIIAQIAAALDAYDFRRAAALADAAGKSGRRDPLIFAARGRWLNNQGMPQEALELLLRADANSVPSAAVKEAIGLCLLSLERMQEAGAAFDAALALEPDSASIRYSRARGYELAGELTSAQRSFEDVVRLQPRNALALGRLAYIAARLGSWDDARKFARRATVVEPRQIVARLALAVADVEQGIETAERRLADLLADDNVQGTDRYIVLGLLGNLRDRQDRVAEAFAEYGRANELIAQISAPRLNAPGLTMHQLVLALTAYYESAAPVSPTPVPTPPGAKPHIFLLGFPRSGTTLLEQVLAGHADVTALGEKETLIDSIEAFLTRPADFPRLANASPQILDRYRERYWKEVARFAGDARGKALVDKNPINIVRLPLIAQLFPNAKILLALRDPRDVVLSCYRNQFDMNSATREFLSLSTTARFYDAVMRLANVYRARLPLDVLELRLEDLIGDFDTKAREVCAFLGLPWDARLRDFARVARTRGVATPSARQVVREINASGVGQWRRYARELEPVLTVLQPWVSRFGYPVD